MGMGGGTGQRKTLRNYLFEEGIKDRFFLSSDADNPGIYQVDLIEEREYDSIARLKVFYIGYNVADSSLLLGRHLQDREATSEEVKRAKESALVKKA